MNCHGSIRINDMAFTRDALCLLIVNIDLACIQTYNFGTEMVCWALRRREKWGSFWVRLRLELC